MVKWVKPGEPLLFGDKLINYQDLLYLINARYGNPLKLYTFAEITKVYLVTMVQIHQDTDGDIMVNIIHEYSQEIHSQYIPLSRFPSSIMVWL